MKRFRRHAISRIRMTMSHNKLDAVLITSPEDRFYLSGFYAEDVGVKESAGSLLITKEENILLTDSRYLFQAQDEAKGWQILIYKKGLSQGIKEALLHLSHKKKVFIGYQPSFLTCKKMEQIKKTLPNIELKYDIEPILERIRRQKTKTEIETIKRAIDVAEEVFDQIFHELKVGMSEKEVAFKILEGLYKKADGPSFPPIVASGPNAALPHAVPTDRLIKEGEPIIIDMGAILNGYCSDMTRTVFLGEISDYWKNIYKIVKLAQEKAQEALRAGKICKEIDKIARTIIKEHGFGKEFLHSLGHGVGVAVHEPPYLSPRYRKKLLSGMVVTIEPGIYISQKGGVRLENMALVLEDTAQILSSNRWFYDWD